MSASNNSIAARTGAALIVLFCEDPLRAGQPDEAFAAEARAARELGIEYGLIGYEALVNDRNPTRAIRRISGAGPAREAVYRGWMLRPSEYGALYDSLSSKGVRLINSPSGYRHCHYLPECYHVIADQTPRSVWLPSDAGFSIDRIMQALGPFGSGPVIVKDYAKSQKHYWRDACYIPSAADAAGVERVVRRFLELQGDSLNEGLVFREYIEFDPVGEHGRSGMPLTREFRFFLRDGEVICRAPYWGESRYDGPVPVVADFADAVARVESRFFTMDVAQRRDGDWMIVELGDGQVAGLPPGIDAMEFYRRLAHGSD